MEGLACTSRNRIIVAGGRIRAIVALGKGCRVQIAVHPGHHMELPAGSKRTERLVHLAGDYVGWGIVRVD